MKVAVALTIIVVAVGLALLLSVDLQSSSTAGLAYVFIPLYMVGALLLIWLVFLGARAKKRLFEDESPVERNH